MRLTSDPILEKCLNEPAEGQQAFALVDGTLHPDIRLRALLGVESTVLKVPGIEDPEARSLLPVLIAWPADEAMKRWLLTRSLAWARANHAVTWLTSPQGLGPLAEHLGACMAGELEDGRRVLLRFSDARTLPSLVEQLGASQRATLLGPVGRWWYLDREELLQELTIEKATASPAEPPLVVSDAQLAAMMDAAEPDVVLRLLEKISADALKPLSRSARHAFVVQCIESARGWGIDASIDFANYCSRELEFGSQCHQSPEWKFVAGRAKAGDMTWSQALNEWPLNSGSDEGGSSIDATATSDSTRRTP